jgi:hypothetical protein
MGVFREAGEGESCEIEIIINKKHCDEKKKTIYCQPQGFSQQQY